MFLSVSAAAAPWRWVALRRAGQMPETVIQFITQNPVALSLALAVGRVRRPSAVPPADHCLLPSNPPIAIQEDDFSRRTKQA